MNLFGKKKVAKAPSINDSIKVLREQINIQDKREEHLQKQVDSCTATIREKMKVKDKRAAMAYLKKKKMFEKEIDQIFNKRNNLEAQCLGLESAASNQGMLAAVRKGHQTLQATVKDSQIDNAAELMDDLNEAMALNDEFSEALSQPIGPQVDEDELLGELDDMENQLNDELLMEDEEEEVKPVKQPARKFSLGDAVDVPDRPVAGGSKPEKKMTKEEREMKELEDLMM